MFAEFEKITHALVEAGEPLTVDRSKTEYGKLLADYFGPDFVIDEELKLECLRIPHFYSASTSTSTRPACRPRSR